MLPAGKMGTFSVFGLGGISHILQSDEDDEGNIVGKVDFGARLGVVGLNHMLPFNRNNFMKITLSASGNSSYYDYEEPDSLNSMELTGKGSWEKSSLQSAVMFSSKLNSRNRFVAGIKFTRYYYDLYEHYLDEDLDRWVYGINMKQNTDSWQSYLSWKCRLGDHLTLISGLHGIYFSVNGDFNLEPRVGLKWQIDPKQTVHLGYGSHSKSESIVTYYTIVNYSDGISITPNKNLGIL